MLRKRIHNIIDFYPLPLSVTLLRASGIWGAGRKSLFKLLFRSCPGMPSMSSPHHSGAYLFCVRLLFTHRLFVFMC